MAISLVLNFLWLLIRRESACLLIPKCCDKSSAVSFLTAMIYFNFKVFVTFTTPILHKINITILIIRTYILKNNDQNNIQTCKLFDRFKQKRYNNVDISDIARNFNEVENFLSVLQVNVIVLIIA